MIEISENAELQQERPISLQQAEDELQRISSAMTPYGDFEHVSAPMLLVFKEACDRRDRAAVREVDRDE